MRPIAQAGKPGDAPNLAVVIPAWNERENLDLLLPALREVISRLGLSAEIVVVDGDSRDGTRAAAERRGARVVLQQEPGYGGALLAGFAATTAPYLVTMDADLSHRPPGVSRRSRSTTWRVARGARMCDS